MKIYQNKSHSKEESTQAIKLTTLTKLKNSNKKTLQQEEKQNAMKIKLTKPTKD